ncbi:TIGR03915 family putative DNA repair protein [Chondrinema litorale]|uniref:TIGR03915 family putative DNA repair protein n=1 Tax=Chondrinema litorale TaxID=2994555 RepID=UPI002542AF03|nr:TIGR03915 family putative DNA repair protein [Chondrinema litorale]UZR96442.1 TIGR03915 family putative DNA repair protein [Chondrinema litorale]
MTTIIFDGTYQGWLTAVFEIYEFKLKEVEFVRNQSTTNSLFATKHYVQSDENKANRVLKGLEKKLSKQGVTAIYKTFLSEVDQADDVMWRFVKYVFDSTENVENDIGNSAVWDVKKAVKKVRRETHRMKAFVRFQLTKDDLYYSIVEPDCDVLPLIITHFKNRFADQRWLIYDAKRKYGIYYDLETVRIVEINFQANVKSSKPLMEISDEREEFYQTLWRRYFNSVNIKARTNMKLHIQHMPKRYWKYLTEKYPDL